jgi:hypothetical protein
MIFWLFRKSAYNGIHQKPYGKKFFLDLGWHLKMADLGWHLKMAALKNGRFRVALKNGSRFRVALKNGSLSGTQ